MLKISSTTGLTKSNATRSFLLESRWMLMSASVASILSFRMFSLLSVESACVGQSNADLKHQVDSELAVQSIIWRHEWWWAGGAGMGLSLQISGKPMTR